MSGLGCLGIGNNSTGSGGGSGSPTQTSTAIITATPGGGQAGAYQITAYDNWVNVVASANDSVKLGSAVKDYTYKVINTGANDLAVYPQPGENFYGYAADAPFIISPGGIETFVCFTSLEWTF